MRENIEIEESTGNVFADLDLPDAEEGLAKADLSLQICRIVQDCGLTQTEAADLLGCGQPDISNLMRGRLSGYSIERLSRFLNALGRDVEITVRLASEAGTRGHLLVSAA